MLSVIRRHLNPATGIAFLALILAMTGGAFAATNGGSHPTLTASAAKAKSGSRGKTGARGPAGPAGKTGATGAAGAPGATGPAGPQGAKGETGTPGAPGTSGEVKIEPALASECLESGVGTKFSDALGNGVVCNGAEGFRGEKGEPGTNGTNGTNGVNGKSVVSKMFKGGNEPQSPVKEPCETAGGSEFEVEGSGKPTFACNGKGGSGGGEGLPKTLPAEKSETGTFVVTGQVPAGELNGPSTAISFPIPLAKAIGASAVTEGVHAVGAAGNKTTCPGSVEDPTAEPGNLCIYRGTIEEEPAETETLTISNGSIVPPGGKLLEDEGTGTTGAVVHARYEGPNAGTVAIQGSWAVTAPAEK
jgi:hypothetical protein